MKQSTQRQRVKSQRRSSGVCVTTNRKMWRKLRATEKRECIRGVEDKRADSLNDKGEVRDLRHKMGGKE